MKNTKSISRFLCFLLATVTVAGCLISFASCKKEPEPEGPQTNDQTVADTNETTNNIVLSDEDLYKPEEKKYNREFTIMTDIPDFFGVADDYKLGNGTILDDAIYKRSMLMANKFGVDTLVLNGTEKEYSTAVTAGQYICDVLMMDAQADFRLILQNLMTDLATLNNLNLEAPYWDRNIQTEYAVGGRLYCLEGDFSYYDEYRTYVMLYNDKLYTDYGYYETYGTPYSMVENGTWTMDKMLTMAGGQYRDINDNDDKDEFDYYGIVGDTSIQWCCFLGSGLKTVETVDGELTLNIKNDSYYNRLYNVLDDVMNKFIGNDDVLYPTLLKEPSTGVWTAASNVFENNRALFRATTLSAATRLGNMASRFGVLPMPAYREGMGGYYGWLPGSTHHPLTMCRNVAEKEESAAIMEAFCYYSRYGSDSLYNAYFESFRISKFCETEDDLKMMDIIIQNKTYDLDYAANITGFADAIWRMAEAEDISTLYSTLTTHRNSSFITMDAFILKILELD